MTKEARERVNLHRRCLRLHDAGASLEHIIGVAYNAGLLSAQAPDWDTLAALRVMPTESLDAWERVFPELVEKVRAERLEEMNREQ